MKRYLIKCTSTAKDTNMKSFAYYGRACYGKYHITLAYFGDSAEKANAVMQFDDSMVAEYGYKRKGDAYRSSFFTEYRGESEYWDFDWEVVEYEIAEGKVQK